MLNSPFSGRDVPKTNRLAMLGAAKALQVETGILHRNARMLEERFTNEDNSNNYLSITGTQSREVEAAFNAIIRANESIASIIEEILGPVRETATV